MAVIQSGNSTDVATVNANKQLYVTDSSRVRSGVYIGNSGLLSVTAAADAATAGKLWITNPNTSTKLIAIRRIELDAMGVAASAAITRLTAERITFTGNPSGAAIVTAKTDSTMPNPQGYMTTASTGMTITAGAAIYSWLTMAVITAAGVAEPVIGEWEPSEIGQTILRPGEGLVIRQPDAGVTSDPRRFTVNWAWDEYS